MLGPGVNIKRSPLCGRNFEYLSEDPLLAGRLAAAMVDGMQAQGVGTSLKHFAANNQETDRLRVSADVDERTLREIYLPAFEHVVTTAQPWTVMCAYNRVNGVYASQHHWLLTEVLRDEWGFDGLVVSDWGAVHDRVAALRAGLDLEMPPTPACSDAAIVAAVAAGALDEAVLDTGRCAGCCALVDAARPPTPAARRRSTSTRTTRWPARGRRRVRRAAARTTTTIAAAAAGTPADAVAVMGEFARRRGTRAPAARRSTRPGSTSPLDELRAPR